MAREQRLRTKGITTFHYASVCWGCGRPARYSTPIPCILVCSSRCEWCRSYQMLGLDGEIECKVCYGLHMAHGDPVWP